MFLSQPASVCVKILRKKIIMNVDIDDILQDPLLSVGDKNKLAVFRDSLSKYLALQQPPGSDWKSISLFHLCEGASIDLSSLAKEGPMLCALWVIILRGVSNYLPETELKYPTYEDFNSVYGSHYRQEDETELNHLWRTANWMNVLFNLLPAKKNKGLVMLVVPRFVEGWHVKYVTGSGQTHATANRVYAFEVEGDCRAVHRGKIKAKPKKKTTPRAASSSGLAFFGDEDDAAMEVEEKPVWTTQHRELSITAADYTHHRKRRHAHVRRETSTESADSEYSGEQNEQKKVAKRARHDFRKMPPPTIPGRCTTDVLQSAANEDLRHTYEEFQSSIGVPVGARDETAILLPDLLRSESFSVWNPSVPGPPTTERSVTWGEIPLNLGSSNMVAPMPLTQNSLASMSQAYSVSSGFLNSPPAVKPEDTGSAVSVVGSSPPQTAGGNNAVVYDQGQISDVFAGYMNAPTTTVSATAVSDVKTLSSSPNKMVFA